MSIATARPAATVIVARPVDNQAAAIDASAGLKAGPSGGGGVGRAGFEILLVRRSDSVAFMAGAYVFPGGRVEDTELESAAGDLTRAFRRAGVRELEEEAGVRVDPEALMIVAHWVTPESEPKRYDTHFFLVAVPHDQSAQHDAGETTELAWLTPAEAIARCQRGEIMLPPPTWTMLKRIQRHRTLDDLIAWARSVAIVPAIQPRMVKDATQTLLTLPGDPSYPTVEGWDVPEDTRFELRDGRWYPR